jgi:Fe-S cluster assembly protein SufD
MVMTGLSKKTLASFNLENESGFLSDFFPTVKNEDWKYTNLKKYIPESIIAQPFENIIDEELTKKLEKKINNIIANKNVIFFIDGVFQKKYSNVPDGVKINKLFVEDCGLKTLYMNQAGTEFSCADEKSYGGFLNFTNNTKLIELNSYLSNYPYVIKFDDSYVNDSRIKVIHSFTNKEAFFNQNRVLFLVEKNANVLIHEEVLNFGKENSVFNMVSEVICLENSSLEYFSTQNDSSKSNLINSIFCTQQKNSTSNFNIFSNDGKLIRNNIQVDLLGENSSSNVKGTSLSKSSQHLDNFITISHMVENCKSSQLFKSVYDDNASGAFCGKIFVEKGAQQTEAYQQNNNLMISKNSSVNAKPQLEIFADDVVCSHGCTIGAIDDDILFYLQSRGIKKEEAIKVLIAAFLNDQISNIRNNEIKTEISNLFLKNQ